MKKKAYVAMALSTILSLGMSVGCTAAEPVQNTICVNGTGVVSVTPDVATLHLQVEKTAKTAAEAQQNVNTVVEAICTALQGMKIAPEDIITSYISIYPQYNYPENGQRTLEGYQAYTSINVKTNDVDNVGSYIDAALLAGATGTNGVTFSLEQPSLYYNQALQEAVSTAESSAQAIATAYGKTIQGVSSVVETSSNTGEYNDKAAVEEAEYLMDSMSSNVASGGGNGTTVSYEDIEVYASIQVFYNFG